MFWIEIVLLFFNMIVGLWLLVLRHSIFASLRFLPPFHWSERIIDLILALPEYASLSLTAYKDQIFGNFMVIVYPFQIECLENQLLLPLTKFLCH